MTVAVVLEHRFYGQSQFTPNSTGPSKVELPYLTHEQVWLYQALTCLALPTASEQAMADYVNFLYAYKAEHSLEKSPVIVFGGELWLHVSSIVHPSTRPVNTLTADVSPP